MKSRFTFAMVGLAVSASNTFAQLENFIVTDSYGALYQIEGETLHATEIAQLVNGYNISEIVYVGNDEILASTAGGYVRYNLNTGMESIEFDIRDVTQEPGTFSIAMAAGFNAQRNVYFGVATGSDNGTIYTGLLYDPIDGSFIEMAQYEHQPSGLYFGYLEVGNHIFLAADWGAEIVRTINAETGETINEFPTQEGVVSFLDLNDDIFVLSREGRLYHFDVEDGSMELHGSISGIDGNVIGATSLNVPQTSDINYDGSRDYFDVFSFLDSFNAREPVADWNDDGIWDWWDVTRFVSDFAAE